MKCTVFSYRYAREILEHPNNLAAWREIMDVAEAAPLFRYPRKSKANDRLDVVQQCLNTWFDRALAVERDWLYHPLATAIENSKLAADFRKEFRNKQLGTRIRVQAEVQFGNMSRWYSDIFKLQTAYSQSLIDIGLSIVPMGILANRIDSNIVSFERVARELPSANLSITLPILVIGIEPDNTTVDVDLSRIAKFDLKSFTKGVDKLKTSEKNRYRLVNALFAGRNPLRITSRSPTGKMAEAIVDIPDEDGA